MQLSAQQALQLWYSAFLESVQRDTPDLTARQTAVLMTVYMDPPPHTVRGLADHLSISRPAVTRALDRLSVHGLVRRKADETDRRSITVQRTVKGSLYLSEFAEVIGRAAAALPEPGG